MRSDALALRRLSSPVSLISPELGCASARQLCGTGRPAGRQAPKCGQAGPPVWQQKIQQPRMWSLQARMKALQRVSHWRLDPGSHHCQGATYAPVNTTTLFSVVAGSLSTTAGARRSCAVASSSPACSTHQLLRLRRGLKLRHPMCPVVAAWQPQTLPSAVQRCNGQCRPMGVLALAWKLVQPTVRSASTPALIPAASASPHRPSSLGVEVRSENRLMDTAQPEFGRSGRFRAPRQTSTVQLPSWPPLNGLTVYM